MTRRQRVSRGAQTFLCFSAVVSAKASTIQQPPDQIPLANSSASEKLYFAHTDILTHPTLRAASHSPVRVQHRLCTKLANF